MKRINAVEQLNQYIEERESKEKHFMAHAVATSAMLFL